MNVFISEFVASKYASWVNGAPYRVLYNGVSVPGCKASRQKKGVGEPYKILLAGRIAPGKGQIDAIKACELLHNRGYAVQLGIVGSVSDQEYYGDCVSYINRNNLNYIHIKSFVDNVAAEYASADIALMCSSAEAMGRVTIEGMLSGCLVVGANAGATPELIEDGKTGLLYESGDYGSLAERIIWAISNADEARSIAKAGTKYAESAFNKDVYASKVLEVYRACLQA